MCGRLLLLLFTLACGEEATTEAQAPGQSTPPEPAASPTPAADPEPQIAAAEPQEDPMPPLLDAQTLEPLEEGIVLLLTQTDPLGGTQTRLVIRSWGAATYVTDHLMGEYPNIEGSGFQVQPDHLLSLAEGLKEAGTCELKSTETHAKPDDGLTTIRLRLDGASCDVLLWNSETSSKRAKTSLNMIRAQIPR